MKELDDYNYQNQNSNIIGLIKGDLGRIEKLPQITRSEDIIINNFKVDASSVNDLMQICYQIECKLESYSIAVNKRHCLLMALIEAVNNAQQHGYQFAKNKMVAINLLKIKEDYILVGIESMGEPIPMNKINNLLNENNPLEIGTCNGRGYILIKNLVDVLYVAHYESYTEVFLGIFNEKEKKSQSN